MMDSANDNWEDLTVEDFQQTANAVIGALGAIESVRTYEPRHEISNNVAF